MKKTLLGSRESLVRRAALLRLTARSLADSMRSGGFRSLYRGQGIEFNGVREYLPGDDVRTIDWNVTARMDRAFVKLFEEERELPVFIIADRSLSMKTGSAGHSRLETESETGAVLTLAAEQNASPVGAVFFDGKIGFACAPKRGFERTMLLLTRFDELPENGVPGSVLANALTGAGKLLHRRSLVFVLSDFRSAGWEHPFALLAEKHDVIAVCITDPQDETLPDSGSIPFSDTETGKTLILPTSLPAFRDAWRIEYRLRIERWKEICRKRGGYSVLLSTGDDPVQVLTRFFALREHH